MNFRRFFALASTALWTLSTAGIIRLAILGVPDSIAVPRFKIWVALTCIAAALFAEAK